MTSRFSTFALVLCMINAVQAEDKTPHWIWSSQGDGTFETEFDLPATAESVRIDCLTDFAFADVFFHGKKVLAIEPFDRLKTCTLPLDSRRGVRQVMIRARGIDGPSAVAARFEIQFKGGRAAVLGTDGTWRGADRDLGPVDWVRWHTESDAKITAVDDYTQWKQALGDATTATPATFFVAPGFQIELVHSAREDEGSWISMAFDPGGRVVIGREDQGLLRSRQPLTESTTAVEFDWLNKTWKECRGLLFAHGSLYLNANTSKKMVRLRDTTGDGLFDEEKVLRDTPGGAGHGRNDLTLGPDGQIYVIHGDSVDLPDDATDLTSPWRESRMGKKMREGHVLRTDRDGTYWELVAAGLRNPYGIAFNPTSDMFTYDADAEFDMGSPWYRPTRIVQIVPGADYGWRGMTGTWPPYYPDHPDNAPPAVDIGKGSPTSVKFGTASNFPPRYQQALFALDWAYGRILAVHLSPLGAGYACRAETFAKGRPLNVTDLDFGADGAMYFVTGGRKTQSGLYRIRFTGDAETAATLTPQPTAQQTARNRFSQKQRQQRRELETLLTSSDPDLAPVWNALSTYDPRLRFIARSVLERQPLTPERTRRAMDSSEGRLALARRLSAGSTQHQSAEITRRLLSRIADTPLEGRPRSDQRRDLHTVSLCLSASEIDENLRRSLVERIRPLFPSDADDINAVASRLLIRLSDERAVAQALDLAARTTDQRQQMHYLFILREASAGWTPELRRSYFNLLATTQFYLGGQGMPKFLQQIKENALAKLSPSDKARFEPLLKPDADEPAEAVPREFVRKWSTSEIAASLSAVGKGRDFDSGKKMFAAAMCSRCHRVGSRGGVVGPDLTNVNSRFSRLDLVESIVNPSKVVAENYRNDVITTVAGKVIVGRILQQGDFRLPDLQVATNPLVPGEIAKIAKVDIESHHKSPVSIMPQGLLDTLTRDQILDLLAFIESRGDRRHPVYSRQKTNGQR